MPKIVYSGQKEIALVTAKTTAIIPRIHAQTPVNAPTKIKIAMTIAAMIRMVLSVFPMFLVMLFLQCNRNSSPLKADSAKGGHKAISYT